MARSRRRTIDEVPRRTRRPRASGTAAARTIITQSLGWLDGFPDPSRRPRGWVVVAPDEGGTTRRIVLDRARLHRSTRAVGRLRRDFPRALPEVVGDADAWSAAITSRLEALKPAVHGRATAPPDLPEDAPFARALAMRRLAAERPALAPLVRAASWSSLVPRDRRRRTLEWLRRHAEPFERVVTGIESGAVDRAAAVKPIPRGERTLAAMLAVLRTARIADRIGARDAAALVELLAAEHGPGVRPSAIVSRGSREVRRRAAAIGRRRSATPRHPEDPGAMLAWLADLHGRDDQTLRQVARLAREARLADLVAWRATDRGHRYATSRTAAPDPDRTQVRRQRAARLEGSIELAANREPGAAGSMKALLDAFVPRTAAQDPRAERAFAKALRAVEGPAEATLVVLHVSTRIRHWRHRPRRATRDAWPAALGALAAGTVRVEAAELDADVRRALHRGLVDLACECALRPHDARTTRRAFAAFARLVDDDAVATAARMPDGWDLELVDRLTTVAPHLDRAADVAAFVSAWQDVPQEGGWLPETLVGTMVDLCEGDARHLPDVLPAFARALLGHDDVGGRDAQRAWTLLSSLAGDDPGRLRRLVAGPESRRFAALVPVAALVAAGARGGRPAQAMPVRASRRSVAWTRRWPKALRPALVELDAVGGKDDAVAVVRAVAGRELPDADALARELDAVRVRMAGAPATRRRHLERRAESLAARIERPPRLEGPALRRVRTKLERRADAALVDAIGARLRRRLREPAVRLVGAADVDAVLALPHAEELVAGLRAVPPGLRAQGGRLLAARTGPPPWLPHDAPANRRFVTRLRRRGLDLGPWLGSLGPLVRTVHGRRTEYELEDDPLVIMRMGTPFRTCLSPGGMNFFSAVVNALDVNKRVVFARQEGRIVGRCLLALTGEGRVLRFHGYAHEDRARHDRTFTDIARRLGEAIGGGTADDGAVAPLLWNDWYDDGPESIDGAFDFTRDGAPLRTWLAALPGAGARAGSWPADEALVRGVAERIAPATMDALVLPRILHLPEVHERPPVGAAILAAVDDPAQLPDEAIVAFVESCREAKRIDCVPRTMLRRHRRAVLRLGGWSFGGNAGPEHVRLIAELDPLAAMPDLRRALGGLSRADDWRRGVLHLGVALARLRLGRRRAARRALREARRVQDDGRWLAELQETWLPELV